MRASFAVAALAAFALTGCDTPTGGGTGDSGSGDAITFTIDDLRGLIAAGDGLDSLELDISEITANAADDAEAMAGYWEHAHGSPESCFPVFAGSYLLAGNEDGEGADDPTMELASLREPADDDLGLVIVNGRVFDDTATAERFLSSVEAYVGACENGYTLADDHGEVVWTVTAFELGTFAPAPDGVDSLTSQEQVAGRASPAQRTTWLQRGNAVIAVYAETYEGGTYELDDVDPVIAAMADRFAALR